MPSAAEVLYTMRARDHKSKNLLLINLLLNSMLGCRLPAELTRVGFQVAALSTANTAMSYTKHLNRRYALNLPAPRKDVERCFRAAVVDFSADIIIPCDDQAAWFVHDVWQKYHNDPRMQIVTAIIERSLGSSHYFFEIEQKSAVPQLARRAGVLVPATILHECLDTTFVFSAQMGNRVVVKTDYTGGGHGVRICQTREQIAAATERVMHITDLNGRVPRQVIQEFIEGPLVCVTGVARSGQLLEAFAFVRVTSRSVVSPSCVIRRLENPRLIDAAARLVKACLFSGFLTIDFINSRSDDEVYLIEINARPSHTTHLGPLLDADLCKALYNHFDGTDTDVLPSSTKSQGKRSHPPSGCAAIAWALSSHGMQGAGWPLRAVAMRSRA